MQPIVLVQLSGKGVLLSLLMFAAVIGVLALVWWAISPAWAIGIGLGLVLLIRGLFALFKPSE